MQNLSTSTKVTRVSNASAAGQTEITGDAVDMRGFQSCVFVVLWADITAGGVQSVAVHGSDDDDSYAALEGASLTVADDEDNMLSIIEISHPRHRYLKPVVSRATQDSAIDGIICLQTAPSHAPTTHDSDTVQGSTVVLAPAESA